MQSFFFLQKVNSIQSKLKEALNNPEPPAPRRPLESEALSRLREKLASAANRPGLMSVTPNAPANPPPAESSPGSRPFPSPGPKSGPGPKSSPGPKPAPGPKSASGPKSVPPLLLRPSRQVHLSSRAELQHRNRRLRKNRPKRNRFVWLLIFSHSKAVLERRRNMTN